jgi:hypothetical protein
LGLLLSGAALLSAPGGCPASELTGKAAPEWDALFQRQCGWIGADGDYSISLTTNTTLWLYSDTFVGDVKDGKRKNAVMIHNSVALQQGTNRPEFFYGRTRNGKPDSFIIPEHGVARGYFWLTHGIRTRQGLFFFMVQVVTVKPDDPFGFKVKDGWLAEVANPDAPPPEWRITQRQVPFTRVSDRGALIFGGAATRDHSQKGQAVGTAWSWRARRRTTSPSSGNGGFSPRESGSRISRRRHPSSRTSAASSRYPGCLRSSATPPSIRKASLAESSSGFRPP